MDWAMMLMSIWLLTLLIGYSVFVLIQVRKTAREMDETYIEDQQQWDRQTGFMEDHKEKFEYLDSDLLEEMSEEFDVEAYKRRQQREINQVNQAIDTLEEYRKKLEGGEQ